MIPRDIDPVAVEVSEGGHVLEPEPGDAGTDHLARTEDVRRGIEEQDPERPKEALVGGRHTQLPVPVAVEIVQEPHVRPEAAAALQPLVEAAVDLADLLRGSHRSRGAEAHDPDGARVETRAVVVPAGAHREVRETVFVDVVQGGQPRPESIARVDRRREGRVVVADGGLFPHGPVGMQEEDPDGPALAGRVRAHGQLPDAVSVEVSERRDAVAERGAVGQGAREPALVPTDLREGAEAPRRLEEQDPHRPGRQVRLAEIDDVRRSCGEIGDSVPVQVPGPPARSPCSRPPPEAVPAQRR